MKFLFFPAVLLLVVQTAASAPATTAVAFATPLSRVQLLKHHGFVLLFERITGQRRSF
jgi:hypothetical protein